MPNYQAKDTPIDYATLHTTLTKKAYKLSEVKDQIERVAWDMVRFKDPDKGAQLWQVQSADDGEYIVALYDEPEEVEKTAAPSTNHWGVLITKNGSALQISYKNDPIISLTSSQLGIPPTELSQAQRYLPEKLASNPKLVQALMKELSPTARIALKNRYPEVIK
jgi:hypothetical protein